MGLADLIGTVGAVSFVVLGSSKGSFKQGEGVATNWVMEVEGEAIWSCVSLLKIQVLVKFRLDKLDNTKI